MANATQFFTVRDQQGRSHSFSAGDPVPDEIAALVGAHVLDEAPSTSDAPTVEDLTSVGADEQLLQWLQEKDDQIADLQAEVDKLTEEIVPLREFRDKISAGDLSDLDLSKAGTDDEDADSQSQPAAPAFDPGKHSVRDVLAYLERADPDEDARVRAAERDGKARPGILGDDD